MRWIKIVLKDGREEWQCEHGVRHPAEGAHDCDKCCHRADFPGRRLVSLKRPK